MEDVLLFTAGLLASDERVAAQVRRQYKWFVVDEFQDVSPLQSALLDLWLGGRDELCVVGDPAQTIYSFAGADAALPPRLPARVPRHHLDRAGPQLPLHPRGRRRRQHPAGRLAQPGRRAARPAAVRPGGELHRPPRRGRRGRRPSPPRSPRLRDGGRSLGEVAVLFRINAQSESFEDALADRGIPYVVRGAARFFERPEVREAVTRLRGAARSGEARRRRRASRPCAACSAGMGWTRRGARPAAARPATAGSRGRRWSTRRRSSPAATPEARPRRVRRRPRPPRRRAARPGRRRRHPRDVPRRQGPGVGRRLPLRAPGRHAADHLRRHPGRGRGGAAAALRRHDPRPRRPALSWARPATPAAAARASRRGSSTRCCPTTARGRSEPAAHRKVASCRECGHPLATGAEKKRGRCADCPASYDEALFERLREWRKERAGEESVPAYVVFTDATLELIAEHKPRTPDALLRISGIGRSKLEKYGDDVLALRRLRTRLRDGLAEKFEKYAIKSFAHYRATPIVFSQLTNLRITVLARPAPDAPKEVAPMNSIKLWMTAQTPSRFGMPMSGHAFGVPRPPMRAPRPRRSSCASACVIAATTGAARRTWASPSPTSRGPLPGDHRPVDNQQHRQPPGRGTRTGIRGLSVSPERAPAPDRTPTAIRSEEGGET